MLKFNSEVKMRVILVALMGAFLSLFVVTCDSRSQQSSGGQTAEPTALCDYNATNDDALPLIKVPPGDAFTTTLFDNPRDRCAQIKGLIEDTRRAVGATDDSDMVRYDENGEFMQSICAPGTGDDSAPLSGVICGQPHGYIMAVHTSPSDAPLSDVQQNHILNVVGKKWQKIFRHYHPNNTHCALVIIDVDESMEAVDRNPANDDDHGHHIVAMKCF